MKTNYFKNKDERIVKAQKDYVRRLGQFAHNIQECVKGSKIYDRNVLPENDGEKWFRDVEDTTVIQLVDKDSVTAIYDEFEHREAFEKICVLNFASYKNPGGRYIDGSSAQEECLCHASILYPVLKKFQESYYDVNKKSLNQGLYTDKAIYSPDIVFDVDNELITCDVITCAAPNLSPIHRYNRPVTEETINETLFLRQEFVMHIAAKEGVKILILGAFGCGVFDNDPSIVASNFITLLETKFKGIFDKVVFAVPDKDKENYKAFDNAIRMRDMYITKKG